MSKLFGIPVGTLALVLAALLVLALATVVAVAIRNRVFVRLGLRSAGRRRGRSALIVAGLMLGTVIIGAALATGDTMSQTIRSTALGALGRADEPTGDLDSENAQEIVALMRRLNRERGLTFLIVTHDISVGRATDRIVRMVDGEIVGEEQLEVRQ